MMGKATSSGSGSASASGGRSSAAAVMRRGFCDCGERVLYLTSHSDANPGRKFWRCRNWKVCNQSSFNTCIVLFLVDTFLDFICSHHLSVGFFCGMMNMRLKEQIPEL